MSNKLEILKDGLLFGGKPFYLASGDMHYFRFFKGGWRRRLQLMKDFGLTAVQTYVPWNLHEAEEGQYCFDDNLNLAEFLELCDEIGLKVMLRPGVYMCAEWDLGGLPYWLLKKKGLGIRTSDPEFMKYVRRYTERLAKEFVPYLSTNGGPIIAVAVENEYASFSDDIQYIKEYGDMLVELGVDVPLFTANGCSLSSFINGSLPEYWTGLDLHIYSDATREAIKKFDGNKPDYIAEFWGGRALKVGSYFARQSAEDVANCYASMLEKGAYVNFYMFCGGTNFGFMNGADQGRYVGTSADEPPRFHPYSTSYDVDAPVSESGAPTQKYFACKKVLKNYLESVGIEFGGTDDLELVTPIETQSIENVTFTESADLLDNIENINHGKYKTPLPLSFEDMNQAYGFVLYRRRIEYNPGYGRKHLVLDELHDRALVYGNGQYMGCYMRDHESKPIIFTVPEEGLDLEILVENLGRINFSYKMFKEHKGILGSVRADIVLEDGSLYPDNMASLVNFENYSLPMKPEDLEKIDYSYKSRENRPAIYKGTFEAKAGVDTFLNFEGWKKGFVFINGFNIGRYWNVGPQGTLYVPGELLKEKNTIHLVELHNENPTPVVRFDSKPSLDDLVPEVINVAPLGV